VQQPSIDLGHVGIFRSLARVAGLDAARERLFFDLLQRKAIPEIEETLAEWQLDPELAQPLRILVDLNGGPDVLAEALARLAGSPQPVRAALDHLGAVVARLQDALPDLDVHIDLGELRGYSYHTGLVFAAFVPGSGQEIARGGRYNEIGRVFGRARAATGFSTDLKPLLRLATAPPGDWRECVLAPAQDDAGLEHAIAELRARGVRVRRLLAGESMENQAKARRLTRRGQEWTVEEP
jgi:ATP phosphoribosyltransferase regulatory subunit